MFDKYLYQCSLCWGLPVLIHILLHSLTQNQVGEYRNCASVPILKIFKASDVHLEGSYNVKQMAATQHCTVSFFPSRVFMLFSFVRCHICLPMVECCQNECPKWVTLKTAWQQHLALHAFKNGHRKTISTLYISCRLTYFCHKENFRVLQTSCSLTSN